MRITQHHSNNEVLKAPDGMTVEECRAAPITRIGYSDGTPAIAKYWEPSQNERALIASGCKVRVEILGDVMPPMIVTAEGA